MKRLMFEIRMLLFVKVIELGLFVLPKTAVHTLIWLKNMPRESFN